MQCRLQQSNSNVYVYLRILVDMYDVSKGKLAMSEPPS